MSKRTTTKNQRKSVTKRHLVKRNIKAISSFFTSFGNERRTSVPYFNFLRSPFLCLSFCILTKRNFTTHKVRIKVENETHKKNREQQKIRFLLYIIQLYGIPGIPFAYLLFTWLFTKCISFAYFHVTWKNEEKPASGWQV